MSHTAEPAHLTGTSPSFLEVLQLNAIIYGTITPANVLTNPNTPFLRLHLKPDLDRSQQTRKAGERYR